MAAGSVAVLQGWTVGVRQRHEKVVSGRTVDPGTADADGPADRQAVAFVGVEARHHRQRLDRSTRLCWREDQELHPIAIGRDGGTNRDVHPRVRPLRRRDPPHPETWQALVDRTTDPNATPPVAPVRGDQSGCCHRTSVKRSKSRSQDTTVHRCSSASAARCASLTRLPPTPMSCSSRRSTAE